MTLPATEMYLLKCVAADAPASGDVPSDGKFIFKLNSVPAAAIDAITIKLTDGYAGCKAFCATTEGNVMIVTPSDDTDPTTIIAELVAAFNAAYGAATIVPSASGDEITFTKVGGGWAAYFGLVSTLDVGGPYPLLYPYPDQEVLEEVTTPVLGFQFGSVVCVAANTAGQTVAQVVNGTALVSPFMSHYWASQSDDGVDRITVELAVDQGIQLCSPILWGDAEWVQHWRVLNGSQNVARLLGNVARGYLDVRNDDSASSIVISFGGDAIDGGLTIDPESRMNLPLSISGQALSVYNGSGAPTDYTVMVAQYV